MVNNAVHYKIAGRFTGIDVKPRGIDAADYVQTGLFFIDMCLVRSGFQSPPLLTGVAVAIACHNFGTAIGCVDLHDVGNRLRVARVIVGDDYPFGDVGCDRVVFQRCDMIVCAINSTALYQFCARRIHAECCHR